jgi:23S rRNA (adenine2503-C2)-methyltransferase
MSLPPDISLSLPHARELSPEEIARRLAPLVPRPTSRLARNLVTALDRDGAIGRSDVFLRAGIGRDRAGAVDRALRLDPLLRLERRIDSSADGGARLVLSLERTGGRESVEAVAIRRRDDLTLCVSSQSGCPLACAFCSTGLLGLRANLTAGEILEQHAWALRAAGRRVTDVVFMGMGEPLLNYDAVLAAAYRLTCPWGAQISSRRLSISTAGIVPRIRQYAREGHPFPLLFSLTSALPEKRLRLMPVEHRHPLPELRDAIGEYQRSLRRSPFVTLEYVAIPGENMGAEDIDALVRFVAGLPAIVNVIPYNAAAGGFRPPSWREVKAFTTALLRLRLPVKVRYSSGKQVGAGCGQLAADRFARAAPAGHMAAPAGIFTDL